MFGSVALALLLTGPQFVQVSTQALLDAGADFSTIAYPGSPRYTAAQASSYDRRSKPGGDWFANGDAGQFVREETNSGRKERVLADLAGPGAVMRVWSANPAGTLRFYFDGEGDARLVANMSDLLRGKDARIRKGRSYVASQGCNLYWPLPYSKSLKITVEGEDARGIYYQVGYRTFGPTVAVQTFQLSDLKLAPTPVPEPKVTSVKKGGEASVGKPLILSGQTVGSITSLTIKVPDAARDENPNLLRRLWLKVKVGADLTVSAPLSAFFNLNAGFVPYETMPMSVRRDGTMISRWVMPVDGSFEVSVTNLSGDPVEASIEAKVNRSAKPSPYRLRCAYTSETIPTRPFRDMTFLDAKGEGLLVGTSLHIVNPVTDWWGEGDEKIRVDGEEFPSTFGTGTEDYFGYAWSSSGLYQHPFMAQIQCDGPGTFGHSQVMRWHVEDPIPFNKSLKFDMEAWHWKEVICTWERAIFWYGSVGSTNAAQDVPVYSPLREVELGSSVKGAVEGEELPYKLTGGTAEKQQGFSELSKGRQPWWEDGAAGDRLTIDLKKVKPGKYALSGHFCHAPDYGIHQLKLDGTDLGQRDFYADKVLWKKIDLGEVTVSKGSKLIVTCLGNRKEALPRRMFGLDYLLFEPR